MTEQQFKKYDEGKGFGFWWQFVLYALVGQLCWNIENQWFNTFLYTHITKDVSYVTAMVILSATLTCFSTFLFGTISDRTGKRQKWLGLGFIIWGFTTIAVGLCQYTVSWWGPAIAATMVVLFDGIMSFVGSIAYDCSFNTWTNDHTNKNNEGKIGWVLGVMPVIATILGTVVGGMIVQSEVKTYVDPVTGVVNTVGSNYQLLFILMGIAVIICGILAFIFTRDSSKVQKNIDGSFWHQFAQPFNFKKLKLIPNIKEMILACLVIALYFTSFNFYFVHLGNWAIYNLKFTAEVFGYFEGFGMILGILLAIPLSKLIDHKKTPLVCLIGLISSFIGLVMIYILVPNGSAVYAPVEQDLLTIFNPKNIPLLVSIFFFGTGEILMTEACMMWIRGLFPDEAKGQFEGLRCVFFVWIPMFLGTIAGDAIIKATAKSPTGETIFDEYGMAVDVPQSNLFLFASFVVLLAFIPLIFAWKKYNKRVKEEKALEQAESK